MVQFPMTWSHS